MKVKLFNLLAVVLLLTSSSLGIMNGAQVRAASQPNLIANPSAETQDATGAITNWTADSWGTSTTTLASVSDAHSGAKALNITTTSRTSGDAKWMPDAVSVTAGQSYTFSDYSKSTVPTELDAAYTNTTGAVSYVYLAAVQPSSAWQLNTVNLNVPSGIQKVVIMHILATAGSLTTDDYSLISQVAPTPTPPPTTGNLIANPSLETPNGTVPANWQTGGWGTNTPAFSYVTNDGHTGTASATVKISSYTDGDAKWYFNPVSVQANQNYTFSDYYKASVSTSLVAQYDNGAGAYSYATLSTVPASSTWQQTQVNVTVPAGIKNMTVFHLLGAVGSLQIDDASLTAVTQTGPAITINSPSGGSTVSGTVTVSATVSAPQGVSHVQFMLDGASLGTVITAAPYQTTWNTTTSGNASHHLGAIVTDNTGATATAPDVIVTVTNNAPAGSNIIANPSVETSNPTKPTIPLNWTSGGWGANTRTFSYLSSGHTGTRSIKTQITSYSSGAAYWYPDKQPVSAGQTYTFSDYYKSNIMSEIDAGVTMPDGTEQSLYIGEAFPSPNSWTKYTTQFTVPSGAVAITFYHNIYAVGYLTTDDYSVSQFSYQGFSRALVSITADDGYSSYYTNGLPILQKYGLTSTAYIISGYIDNDPAYMTLTQLKSLYASGQEIGSHSVTHPDLTTLTSAQQISELKNSQTSLQGWLGVPITDYAAPYGAYNQQVVTNAAAYYKIYRGVTAGYNAKNNFDAMHLMVQNILVTTTTADIQSWIAQARATNTWLILVYHQVDSNTNSGIYNTYPADFDAQMAAVKASGVTVKTIAQAMAEITPQLTK